MGAGVKGMLLPEQLGLWEESNGLPAGQGWSPGGSGFLGFPVQAPRCTPDLSSQVGVMVGFVFGRKCPI